MRDRKKSYNHYSHIGVLNSNTKIGWWMIFCIYKKSYQDKIENGMGNILKKQQPEQREDNT